MPRNDRPDSRNYFEGGSNLDIKKVGIENGMITLRRAGLMNAMRGITSIEEVVRCSMGEEEG